jgi:hypothetical protein
MIDSLPIRTLREHFTGPDPSKPARVTYTLYTTKELKILQVLLIQKNRVVDPDSMTLWIRIGNPDYGSGSRGKKKYFFS